MEKIKQQLLFPQQEISDIANEIADPNNYDLFAKLADKAYWEREQSGMGEDDLFDVKEFYKRVVALGCEKKNIKGYEQDLDAFAEQQKLHQALKANLTRYNKNRLIERSRVKGLKV